MAFVTKETKALGTGGVIEPTINENVAAKNPEDNYSGRTQMASGLDRLKTRYKPASSLSPEGVAFKDALVGKMKESTFEGTTNPILGEEPVSVHINGIGETLFLTGVNNNTYVVIFKNGFNASYIPPTENIGKITGKLREYHPRCNMFSCMVVDPDSYKNIEGIYLHIFNSFVYTSKDAIRLDLTNVSANHEFRNKTFLIDTNIHNVNAALNEMGQTTAVRPRIDYGFVIKTIEDGRNAYGQNDVYDTAETFVVIGGYTDFVRKDAPGGGANIVPIVTITTIESIYQNRELLAMYLPIAVQELLMNQLWLQPYMKFGANDTSLAFLVDDPTFKITSPVELNHVVQNILTEPELAIDVSVGRPMFPGIVDLVFDEVALYNELARFVGFQPAQNAGLCKQRITEYSGVFKTQGQEPMDLKCVDFLAVAPEIMNEQVKSLIIRHTDPNERIRIIRSIYGDDAVDVMYNSYSCILDHNVINNLSGIVLPQLNIKSTGNNKMNQIGFAQLGVGGYTATPVAPQTISRQSPYGYKY